jgi:hypothetical protein
MSNVRSDPFPDPSGWAAWARCRGAGGGDYAQCLRCLAALAGLAASLNVAGDQRLEQRSADAQLDAPVSPHRTLLVKFWDGELSIFPARTADELVLFKHCEHTSRTARGSAHESSKLLLRFRTFITNQLQTP